MFASTTGTIQTKTNKNTITCDLSPPDVIGNAATVTNGVLLSSSAHYQNSDNLEKCHDQNKKLAPVNCSAASTNATVTSSNISVNGVNINKSWYARCNRWRSQSCDRKHKNSTVRYSWNTINNRLM